MRRFILSHNVPGIENPRQDKTNQYGIYAISFARPQDVCFFLTGVFNTRFLSMILIAALVCQGLIANAQIPRISTFFPIGGRAGTTVSVEMRGSSLDGASLLITHGKGVNGTVGVLTGGKADDIGKSLWNSKCGSCHELRSPANRSMTAQQWTATVDRMIKVRQAPIAPGEAVKITAYLIDQAKNGKLAAQIKIAEDALPGLYEIRVVTTRGVSTVGLFEVGNLPEVLAINNTRQTAQSVKLPLVANGTLAANGERHYYRFEGKKGSRLVFNLKGTRYHETTVLFFNPDLRLYDSAGKEIVENHGYFDLDPLIDWTCPADGPYTLEVRDLLGRGNPGSVYRLTMGQLPYDTSLYPVAAQAGTEASIHVTGKNIEGNETKFTLPAGNDIGVTTVGSPYGSQPFYVSKYPVVTDEARPSSPVQLPSAFSGRIGKPGESATYPITGEGNFEFEVYSGRVGSPANIAVTLLDPAGRGINRMGNDGRMTAKLESGKNYSLKVEEAAGQGGANYTYAIDARPSAPTLEVVARPSNINLRPGLSTPVEVIVTRREGVTGDIELSAEDLPSGVTVTSTVIQPDRNENLMIFTAAPGMKPVQAPIKISAMAHGPAGLTTVRVIPQETYVMQNQPRQLNRAENVVSVRGESEFIASIDPKTSIKVHPRRYTEVKVKIQRRPTFKGNVTARIVNLPLGWVCYQETVGGDKDEIMLLIRPDGNDTRPFLNRDPKLTPIRAVLEANSDEFVFAMGSGVVTKDESPDIKKTTAN